MDIYASVCSQEPFVNMCKISLNLPVNLFRSNTCHTEGVFRCNIWQRITKTLLLLHN